MPELPEVETVKEVLKRQVLNRTVINCCVYYPNIIATPIKEEFEHKMIGQTIQDIKRRGKWLEFILDDYILLSHLRMEGKYFLKDQKQELLKHEHVTFLLDTKEELRYHDTRKFGRMYLVKKDQINTCKPINELGLEPWSDRLTITYLLNKYKKKRLPIKTVLLDQSIIAGIGNIYADEILFLCKLNPYKRTDTLTKKDCMNIIVYTKHVLEKAIALGGTTIRSYTSSEGVHGRFQNELLVHGKEVCPICGEIVKKEYIGGRGTYYCAKCQRRK